MAAPSKEEPSPKEYTEEDLEGFLPQALNDASYFEKAQDFRHLMKTFRIRYKGLHPENRLDKEGNPYQVFVKDEDKIVGINDKGVEACIRFLETRLNQHTVLTSWDEERMMAILRSDMDMWFWMMLQNEEEYELQLGMFMELATVINDLLEFAYRRAIGDEERNKMRPFAKEIRRLLGWDKEDERDIGMGLPQIPRIQDQMKQEVRY